MFKKNLEKISYCVSKRLMDHIMMIIIFVSISSIFVCPKQLRFDLNCQELKIICPNFV